MTALNKNREQINEIFNEFEDSLKNINFSQGDVNRSFQARGITENNISKENLEIMAESSFKMFDQLGFEDKDYYEMFQNNNREEIKTEISAAAILLYTINSTVLPEMTEIPQMYNPGTAAVDCFLEVTGIAAAGLIAGVANWSSSGALKTAFIKLMRKVGPKVVKASIGGIGLVLMAAEFAWCMYRQMSTKMETLALEDILPPGSYLFDPSDDIDYAYTITIPQFMKDLAALKVISENVYLNNK